MKKSVRMVLGACMAAVIGTGLVFAVDGADNKTPTAADQAVSDCSGGGCGGAKAIPQPQKIKVPGITLINPANAKEAVLLVQMAVQGPDGKPVAQMVGLPIHPDENGAKLITEFGITETKPANQEEARNARKVAMEKFVMVSGTVSFDTGAPVLTVEKYESAKGLLAQAQKQAAARKSPASTEPSAPQPAVN